MAFNPPPPAWEREGGEIFRKIFALTGVGGQILVGGVILLGGGGVVILLRGGSNVIFK